MHIMHEMCDTEMENFSMSWGKGLAGLLQKYGVISEEGSHFIHQTQEAVPYETMFSKNSYWEVKFYGLKYKLQR